MKGVMKILMLSCKEAAALSSKKSFEPLTFKESLQFKMHTSVCKACKAFSKQNELLDSAIEKALNKDRIETIQLSDNQRVKIKKSLSE